MIRDSEVRVEEVGLLILQSYVEWTVDCRNKSSDWVMRLSKYFGWPRTKSEIGTHHVNKFFSV